MYDYRTDHFDSRAEQARQIEDAEESARTFDALGWEAREDAIAAQREAFLSAQYKTAMAHYLSLDGFDRFEACAPVAPVSMHVALTANGVSVRLKAVA
jgi:hypothetical protein